MVPESVTPGAGPVLIRCARASCRSRHSPVPLPPPPGQAPPGLCGGGGVQLAGAAGGGAGGLCGGPGADLSGGLSLPAGGGGVAGPEPGGGGDGGPVRAGGAGGRGAAARLLEVLDGVNGRWGRGTLRYLAEGGAGGQPWRLRRERLSPAYTTDWAGLPGVG